MSDIVKRLREKIIVDAFAKGSISDGALCDRLIRERLNAADEIEKLDDTRFEYIDMINKLVDEREKLKKALTAILNDVGYHNPMRMTTEISDKVLFEAKAALNEKIL